jgi:hypothetical protein
MAKKNYKLNQTPEESAKSLAVATLAGKTPATDFLVQNSATTDLQGFEDKSLPPILKTAGLNNGDIIMGEIASFSVFDDGKDIQSALITIHGVRPESSVEKDGSQSVKFARTGSRGALPVGAVLARALSAPVGKDVKPQEQIDAIQAAGYIPGTIIAMKYLGVGKKRGAQNAPHLWDIKVKKPTGEVTKQTVKK